MELKLIDNDISSIINHPMTYLNYDYIVSKVKAFERILDKMRNDEYASLNRLNNIGINEKLDLVFNVFEIKKENVESFKSLNSIITNSLRYLYDIKADMDMIIEGLEHSEYYMKNYALTSRIINFLSLHNVDKHVDIKDLLLEVKQFDSEEKMSEDYVDHLTSFKRHTFIVVENTLKIDDIISSNSQKGVLRSLNALEEELVMFFNEIKSRQEKIKYLLFFISIFFFAGLVFFHIKEEKVKKEMVCFNSAIENSDNSIVITDLNGNIEYVNKAFEKNTGYTALEVLGKNPGILNSGQQDKEYFKGLWDRIGSGKAWQGEFINRKKDGTIFYEKATITPIFKENGSLNSYLAIKLDITKEKEILKRLEELNRTLDIKVQEEVEKNRQKDRVVFEQSRQIAMSELLINISHHWRQPLNVIGVIAQDIEELYAYGELEEESLRKKVKMIMYELLRLSGTIEIFNEIYRPSQNKVAFSPSETINKTLSLLEGRFVSEIINVNIETDKNISITGNPAGFSQALEKILINSIDVLKERKTEKREIYIELYRDKTSGNTVIKVSDNGGGIEEEIIDKIFDPYFTTEFKKTGKGLSLYLAKTIIETEMFGTLNVRNNKDGAEFTIEL